MSPYSQCKPILALALLAMLASCSIKDAQEHAGFPINSNWALLPALNYADAPLAGEKAEGMIETLLRAKGLTNLQHYPSQASDDMIPELNERKRLEQAQLWAKQHGYKYGVTALISEWRYKSGLDGEPATGITLQVMDVQSAKILWSSSAARSGWGRESLSGNAQKVVRQLVDQMPLE